MNIHSQIIKQNGTPAFVVIPYKEYEKILEALETIEDLRDAQEAIKDSSERFPFELVKKIADGESPIKAYRQYRKMTQITLAKKLGVSKQYISQIEMNQRKGTPILLKKIAKILKVELDDIII